MPVLAQLKRSALLFLIAWGIMLQPALTPAGFAHANVVRSNPAANSVLEQPPAAVTLWFTEPLEAQLSHIQVLDSQGRRVDTGNSLVDGTDPTQLSVELLPLPEGTYVVAWTNVSTVDGHKVRGSFVFSVGEPLNPAVIVVPAPPTTLQSPLEPVLRWLSLLTVLFVTGGLAFDLLDLRPCLRRGDADDVRRRLGETLAARMLKAIWPALGLLVLASVGQLLLQTMITFEVSLPQALGQPLLTVMLETGWGRLWLVRMALLLMMPAVIDLAITAPISPRLESSRPMLFNQLPRFTAVGLGASLLLTLSLTSHAAATPEIRVAAIFNDYLHLLAASFWAGSLLHFALGAPLLAQHLPASNRRQVLLAVVSRFSVVAGLSVAVLFVTGLFSAYAQVTIWPALMATLYG